MYPSLSQIIASVGRLSGLHPFFGYAFFAFKKVDLPVGGLEKFSYSEIRAEILEPYYHLSGVDANFFNPFKSNHVWVSSRYESTSLQRVIADTFGAAFLRNKTQGLWGWRPDYISVLRSMMSETQSSRIPLVDLAVWLYRDEGDFPEQDTAKYAAERIISEFNISPGERAALCSSISAERVLDLQPSPVSDTDILNVIGRPAGVGEQDGVYLSFLRLDNVGPSSALSYYPSSRLNVIAGDNSLGKTFLLETSWWALTNQWISYPAEPRLVRDSAEISYVVRSPSGSEREALSLFDRIDGLWQESNHSFDGLALFARHDGSVAVWDSLGSQEASKKSARWLSHTTFYRNEIWDGLTRETPSGRKLHVSNGLIRDWITWESAPEKYGDVLSAFQQCLRELSPPGGTHLRSGKPTKLLEDSRDIPTLRMPYGEIPIVYASAGIQRILGLAYMLVSQWHEHCLRATTLRRQPVRQLVIFLDEIEAHLHPRWQRQILPALVASVQRLSNNLSFQLHVGTHSPLILASVEGIIDPDADSLHQLSLSGSNVTLERVPFVKQGSVDSWLESDLFGLEDARSKPGELAINDAKTLQLAREPSRSAVEKANQRLLRYLPDDDPFWVRWLYFYEQVTGRELNR